MDAWLRDRLLLAALLLGAAPTAWAQATAPDTAILRFFAVWDSTWRLSERDRSPKYDLGYDRPAPGGPSRRSAYHCHPYYGPWIGPNNIRGTQIRSRHAWFATCPGWFLGGHSYEDGIVESEWIDAAISRARRPVIHAARDTLLTVLEQALQSAPSDSFLIGQAVRFAIDQRDWTRTFALLDRCAGSRAWCEALRGYALMRNHRWDEAATVIARAHAAADPTTRCRWRDVALLLDTLTRKDYVRLACEAREPLEEWLWTLTRPLWLDTNVRRRSEQFRRVIEVALRQALPRDERWNWVDTLGADALVETILRYGWPSFVYWGGPFTDTDHGGVMGVYSTPTPPFTTYEYSPGRQHLVPNASAVMDPFSSRGTDWDLNPPPNSNSFRRTDPLWWPIEHFAPPYPLAQLPEGQTAFLRRQTHIHLATATPLDVAQTKRQPQETVDPIHLLIAHTPDSIRPLATTRGLIGSPAVLTADIEPRPAVLSIEYTGVGPGRLAGRARYGIRPPEALAALAPGERAISDPVILRVPSLNSALPSHPDSALRWMAGTTTIPPVGTLGVYWETYGFAPDDSVEHAVWIQRVTPQGTLRRLGISLQVATDRNTPVATSWTETRLGPTATDLGGPVRIIGRSLLLNVAALPRGEYVLEVAATVGGHPPVRGQRSFTIQ